MPNDYENPLNPENRQTPWEAASKPGNAKQFYDQVGSGAKALTAVPSGLLLATENWSARFLCPLVPAGR